MSYIRIASSCPPLGYKTTHTDERYLAVSVSRRTPSYAAIDISGGGGG